MDSNLQPVEKDSQLSPEQRRLQVVGEICELYASSHLSIASICASKPDHFPNLKTLWKWSQASPSVAEAFSHARVLRATYLAEQALELADNASQSVREKSRPCQKCGGLGRIEPCEFCHDTGKHPERPETWKCGKCKCRECAGKGFWLERTIMDNVERADLQCRMRQWLASKYDPETYGDRTTVDLNVRTEQELRSRLMAARGRVLNVSPPALPEAPRNERDA